MPLARVPSDIVGWVGVFDARTGEEVQVQAGDENTGGSGSAGNYDQQPADEGRPRRVDGGRASLAVGRTGGQDRWDAAVR